MSQVFSIAMWHPIEDLINNPSLHFHAVLLFHEDLIDEFNPEGVVEGFYSTNDDPHFLAGVWNNDQDCWDTLTIRPSHYMLKIKGPTA